MEDNVDWVDVTSLCRVLLLVNVSVFVTNRTDWFWVVCNLCLVGRVRDLRGTVV